MPSRPLSRPSLRGYGGGLNGDNNAVQYVSCSYAVLYTRATICKLCDRLHDGHLSASEPLARQTRGRAHRTHTPSALCTRRWLALFLSKQSPRVSDQTFPCTLACPSRRAMGASRARMISICRITDPSH